ncbi:release factor glutamine methyltransferase [Salinimicrobium marinum]|uniref:Release factor glutamine methyltransferase n=1 Tax=Salinimicrobium marinum TaxID=680283 RepID=A0A918SBS9_9FLAO|nr:peptide chain release factor N(5)-glutamine methyltransferase [Salinimicrobium marinum]GHA34809.1 release factor glutamine methyltransferase [Salinimicrobium marinum]
MKLLRFKEKFTDILKQGYPLQEVNSFFNLLTEEILGMSRLHVALDPEKEISESEQQKLEDALQRLQEHEPIQYILGETEFFGLTFKVDKNVLIPRPETEELVEWILSDVKNLQQKEIRILDIGTGSGCIAISLGKNLPSAKVTAIDISEGALEMAKRNADFNNVNVEFIQQDILEAEALDSNYDIIVSNPPYVRELEKKEMQANVLNNEPAGALYVKDEDPLAFYRKITELATKNIKKGGSLYFEINQYLGEETKALLTNNYFTASLKKDIFGNDRMLKGEIKK